MWLDQALEGVHVAPASGRWVGMRCGGGAGVHELARDRTRRGLRTNRSDGLARPRGSALARTMIQPSPSPLVHLELHTGNLVRACSSYSRVSGWHLERVEARGHSYRKLDWGGGLEGGIVERGTSWAAWVPYLEVPQVDEDTECARRFGLSVLLELREGPAGWRSVFEVPDGGEIASWQSKATADRR